MCMRLVFGLLLILLPFVTHRYITYAEEKKKAGRPVLVDLSVTDKLQHEFHRAEFNTLHAEVAELVKANSTNFQYALIASGGIVAWLAGATFDASAPKPRLALNSDLVEFVWLVPLFITSLFAALSAASLIQIERLGDYLGHLEKALGHQPLGWQRFFDARAPTSGLVFTVGWSALLLGDLAIALVGPA